MVSFNPDDNILFCNEEAHLHLDRFLNKQRFRYWSFTNPEQYHDRPIHSSKVIVSCGVAKSFVIGPYFFEEGIWTVTVDSERYPFMLLTLLILELRRKWIVLRRMWYKQDGAIEAHTANVMIEFGISRFGDIAWPGRSSDQSVSGFSWGAS